MTIFKETFPAKCSHWMRGWDAMSHGSFLLHVCVFKTLYQMNGETDSEGLDWSEQPELRLRCPFLPRGLSFRMHHKNMPL